MLHPRQVRPETENLLYHEPLIIQPDLRQKKDCLYGFSRSVMRVKEGGLSIGVFGWNLFKTKYFSYLQRSFPGQVEQTDVVRACAVGPVNYFHYR